MSKKGNAADWVICAVPLVALAFAFGLLWYRTPPMHFKRMSHSDQPYHGGAPYGTILYPADLSRDK